MTKKELILIRLQHDVVFLKLALIRLYSQQQEDEQEMEDTLHDNGKGFNKADVRILTNIAQEMVLESIGSGIPPEHITIIPEALDQCRKRLPKYVGQLEHLLTDEEVL